MAMYVLRLWLPDRPGALGAVASRVGAVGGDVVGIDILERGAGRAVDELVVELPDELPGEGRVDLMVAEISQVDGVDVEHVRPATAGVRDPRLDALETAAILVGADTPEESVQALCEHASGVLGAEWAVVVADEGTIVAATGDHPTPPWLAAYLEGSRQSARLVAADAGHGSDDVAWAPLPRAGTAFVVGRTGTPFRARERRQIAALARIVDARFRDLARERARLHHPSLTRGMITGGGTGAGTGVEAQSTAQVRALSTARSQRA